MDAFRAKKAVLARRLRIVSNRILEHMWGLHSPCLLRGVRSFKEQQKNQTHLHPTFLSDLSKVEYGISPFQSCCSTFECLYK